MKQISYHPIDLISDDRKRLLLRNIILLIFASTFLSFVAQLVSHDFENIPKYVLNFTPFISLDLLALWWLANRDEQTAAYIFIGGTLITQLFILFSGINLQEQVLVACVNLILITGFTLGLKQTLAIGIVILFCASGQILNWIPTLPEPAWLDITPMDRFSGLVSSLLTTCGLMMLGLHNVSQALQRERTALDETTRTLLALQKARDNNEERARLSELLVKLGRKMGSKNSTKELFEALQDSLNMGLETPHIWLVDAYGMAIGMPDSTKKSIPLPDKPYQLLTDHQRNQLCEMLSISLQEEGVVSHVSGQGFACTILIMGPDQSCNTPSRAAFIKTATGLMAEALNRATAAEKLLRAQKLEALGRLAAGIAHDFNNLLTAILGSADLIEVRLQTNQDPSAPIAVIQDTARRASGLTRKLMTFTLAQPQPAQNVDICKLIRDMVPMLSRTIEERVHISTSIPPNSLWVHADPIDIEQIILNLVLNARDAISGPGLIHIRVVLEPNRVRIDVIDDGVGIEPQVLTKIFEPFFSTRKDQGGHGLGLTSAFELAHKWRGDIQTTSVVGDGATFTVYLPCAPTGQTEPLLQPTTDSRTMRILDVLVVEDNITVQHVVHEFLKNQGHRVSGATSGSSGIVLLQQQKFDVVISDVVMPEVDGYALASFARESLPGLPIILISGYAPPAKENLPNVHWLMKPFSQKQLLDTVDQAMNHETKRA